ncbi:hypothetical protein [Halalkalibacter okhensis]|uniref:Uncharacterized protein n=1 Tax=Halalkalibacter okhensis TaxID=333138 RepID=A0A0B0IG38_9BACI|nr:hypothetical protein [Halalkalibacter okhensis]KHF41558.1 hypothetical protein LQ50_02275 [Halalkalibacter okhensis]
MRTITEMKEELLASKGQGSADLVLVNAKVVFIHTEEIVKGCVYIKNGRIIAIHQDHCLKANDVFDCEGNYVIPYDLCLSLPEVCRLDEIRAVPGTFTKHRAF